MINKYPAWKYLVIIAVLIFGALYSLPNFYGKDPALVISPLRANEMNKEEITRITQSLDQASIKYDSVERIGKKLQIRFANTENQLKATDKLNLLLENQFVVAQNLAPSTPEWLRAINGKPMSLGLDLQGGVHFLMDVDMDAAITKEKQRYVGEIKTRLRDKTIRHAGVTLCRGGL